MLLTEDKEIIDIYNREVLKENTKPMPKDEAERRNQGAAQRVIDKFFASKDNGKHINQNYTNPNTGSIFQGYSTVTLKNALLDNNLVWSMPEKDGKDKKRTCGNFPIGKSRYGEIGVLPLSAINDNDDIELHLKGNKLEAVFDFKGAKPKTNIVTMIYNDSDPNPDNLDAKSIYPGPNRVGRNNVLIDSKDTTGPNLKFIQFARLVKK